LAHLVAEGERRLRRLQEELVTDAVAQLVLRKIRREVRCGGTPGPALYRHDLEAGIGELVRENRAGPTQPNDGHVFARKSAGHRANYRCRGVQSARPPMLTGGRG